MSDPIILEGKGQIPIKDAEEYLSLGRKAMSTLIAHGVLTKRVAGRRVFITTYSIRKYLGEIQ